MEGLNKAAETTLLFSILAHRVVPLARCCIIVSFLGSESVSSLLAKGTS